jgi:hypothetical protein
MIVRRLLARSGEPVHLPPPPDLVTRTGRRLPPVPPVLAARIAARRRTTRLAIYTLVFGAIALVALVSLLDVLGGRPQLALLFGDGGSGLSRALLTLHLLAKPLVRTVGAIGAPLLVLGGVVVIGAGWMWWLLRRPPAYSFMERTP